LISGRITFPLHRFKRAGIRSAAQGHAVSLHGPKRQRGTAAEAAQDEECRSV
jgi:hypothetical protein